MEQRLAYRIASAPPIIMVKDDRPGVREFAEMEKAAICRCEKFILDNVDEFCETRKGHNWDLHDDVPNWAPIFPSMFLEWNEVVLPIDEILQSAEFRFGSPLSFTAEQRAFVANCGSGLLQC